MLLEKLKSNTTINAQEIAKLVELTSNTQNNIEALVKLNAETAANVVDKANLAYSKSKVIFLVVSILLTAISVITALAITRLLRNYMKQVNILAEKLSKYDFTAETDDEGKNEFTEMNGSLKTVIENIKEAIRTVKKCRNFKSKFRKLISSIRRISIIFARTCRDYATSCRRDIYSGK